MILERLASSGGAQCALFSKAKYFAPPELQSYLGLGSIDIWSLRDVGQDQEQSDLVVARTLESGTSLLCRGPPAVLEGVRQAVVLPHGRVPASSSIQAQDMNYGP
jgi:hypothetical protein